MERADLSTGLGVGQSEPLSQTPGAMGQASPEAEDSKARRRESPPEQSPPEEPSADTAEDEESDQHPHRIDRLA
jgi:hypothetical protein